jgi:hypothetical protein
LIKQLGFGGGGIQDEKKVNNLLKNIEKCVRKGTQLLAATGKILRGWKGRKI